MRGNSVFGQARQGEDDDQMDDAAQHHAAGQPEQEARHGQASLVMAGIEESLEKPEKVAVS